MHCALLAGPYKLSPLFAADICNNRTEPQLGQLFLLRSGGTSGSPVQRLRQALLGRTFWMGGWMNLVTKGESIEPNFLELSG